MRSDIPPSEFSTDRLTKEAVVFLTAGTSTVGGTLDVAAYYILANEKIRNRLRGELKEIMADFPVTVPSLSDLEKLPYLRAVVREALR